MNDLLCQKIDELCMLFEQDPRVHRLQELAMLAESDASLHRQKEKLTALEEDKYSSTYREERVRFASYPLVEEYVALEKELRLLILEINRKFRCFTEKKGCSS